MKASNSTHIFSIFLGVFLTFSLWDLAVADNVESRTVNPVLSNLQASYWLRIDNSKLKDVLPKESFEQPIHGIVGPRAIVGAWSGGAFDSLRNRIMVIGGGHADYCGNEWLAFDLDDLKWTLLNGPSPLEGYDDRSGMTPDGSPASRHTYNGLAYIPSTDELLMHGGSLCNGAGSADNRWWVGNPASGRWSFQGGKGTWLLGYTTAFDSLTGQVFESRRGALYSYNPKNDVWVRRGNQGDVGKSSMTGDIDPKRRKFLLLGQGSMYVFDLQSFVRRKINIPEGLPVAGANAPGLAYVQSLDRYVAWSGGRALYYIHPETWEFETVVTMGSDPGAAASRGTYGRFRYSQKYDGFVLVNGIDSDVYFLKTPAPSTSSVYESKPVSGSAVSVNSVNADVSEFVFSTSSVKNIRSSSTPTREVQFGPVWCPRSENGGRDFNRVLAYSELPNDPLGDGENNCYMEAFDTSIFSRDGAPVKDCENLDLKKFPGHICTEVSTAAEFKSLSYSKKIVAIIINDLQIQRTFEPYLASKQSSLVVIGTYDTKTMRPVLIKRIAPAPSTFFNWNVGSKNSRLALINLRMHGALCVQVSDRGKTREFVGISITAKCTARFIMASGEKDGELGRVDNLFYLKNVMARSKNSHTVYLDRTYLNWIEDSLIMGPWLGGKHAAKYTGQNVVIKNSLHSNSGVHGEPIVDPEYFDKKWPTQGRGGLAPISMASCNRAVLDGVTVVNHVIRGNSNPQAIQWQFRDALGAGCDMPRIYRSIGGAGPHRPYYGPTWYKGKLESPSSAWEEEFWKSPKMLNSYVINSHVFQTYGKESPGHGGYYSMMSDGTYPSVRDSSSDAEREAAEKIPNGWIERQRIHVSGNCLDNGVSAGSFFNNHVLRGMRKNGKHRYDNTDKFLPYGSNRCADTEPVAPPIVESIDSYLASLPSPPWIRWGKSI